VRACLYTCMYLDGEGFDGSNRLERNIRYVWYYRKLKKLLGFTHFVFCDNASSAESRLAFLNGVVDNSDIIFLRNDQHLTRNGGYDYPYCWRAMNRMKELFPRFDKIYAIDSDYFLCSERIVKHAAEQNSGWIAYWCLKYLFPESACQILNKDIYHQIQPVDWMTWNGRVMEPSLPYTDVCRDFNTDRYGESSLKQEPWMDGYGQANGKVEIIYQT